MKKCIECDLEFDETAFEICWDYAICFSCNESNLAIDAAGEGDHGWTQDGEGDGVAP